MKKQTTTTQFLIHAAVAIIAFATPSKAAGELVAYGDFDNDGLEDMAEVTSPTTITVSLANWDGSYTVSAILTAPKYQQFFYVGAYDLDGDGDLDVYADSPIGRTSFYRHMWLGNGDGTFGSRTTKRYSWPKRNQFGGF